MKIYRNAKGVLRNIGEWDYMEYTDEEGVISIHNPLPEGYSVQDEPVVQSLEDGGYYLANDSRVVGKEVIPVN